MLSLSTCSLISGSDTKSSLLEDGNNCIEGHRFDSGWEYSNFPSSHVIHVLEKMKRLTFGHQQETGGMMWFRENVVDTRRRPPSTRLLGFRSYASYEK